MRITSTIGATKVSHDGETYTADDNGVLEVPQDVGEELTDFPIWLPEHVAAERASAERAAADNDVVRLAARVAELEAWRAEQEKPKRRGRKPTDESTDDSADSE